MFDKYLSIITNFGCHGKCPYCIVRENGINVPKTTIDGLNDLESVLQGTGRNIISVSGGGDPLHEYEKHFDWYRNLFKICRFDSKRGIWRTEPIPIEMHTSYMTDEVSFPFNDCYRVVYHANTIKQLSQKNQNG